jgi:hypothetical protein
VQCIAAVSTAASPTAASSTAVLCRRGQDYYHSMAKVRFRISMSLDGYTAGPAQSKENPLGIGGERLHEWVFPLAAWRAMHGLEGGEVNESNRVVEESLANIGATIMGRNMFGGHPGPWDSRGRGTGGGAPIRRFTIPYSCSPITPGHRSCWRAETLSLSSPMASRRAGAGTARSAGDRTCRSRVGRTPLSCTPAPAWWTRWRSAWFPTCTEPTIRRS